MPQLSPMSWVLVISVFLACFICFAVMLWWVVEEKYAIASRVGKHNKVFGSKKYMKWGFSSALYK
uniref:ATP synthase F0 subunit 8 n=1 Tax=Aculamprotula tientsinensis TaxID=1758753 RepID=A0A125QW82_9BIVA|nr:ATP synthase F0 subunit 8 [Aculamprotula tientsinensis]ALP29953.1 ATP synthase F0 subunit 8 [Aculamprotula tientsinensis]